MYGSGIYISGTYISGIKISNYNFNLSIFGGTGKDGPVRFGNPFSKTSGISPFTLPKTSFIIFALNCSLVTYLYVKKPPPKMPNIRIPVTIVIMSKTFRMIKEALIKASVPITFMVLFLIIGLAPLYVMYGIIDRNIPVKSQ